MTKITIHVKIGLTVLLYLISISIHAQMRPTQLFQLQDFMIPVKSPVYWKEIFNNETLRAGYYHLKKGATDDQNPHEFDEVYWIENGKSKIRIGEKDYEIQRGDVIYVQAKQVHFFHETEEDLDILVLFSKGPFDAMEKIDQVDHLSELEQLKNPSKEIWTEFLKKKSMIFGLLMIPASSGMGPSVTHSFDEVSFVVKGNAILKTSDATMNVKRGSLVVIPRSTAHHFEVREDLEVFKLFATKSKQ